MSAPALQHKRISVEHYLAGELDLPVKHEYVGGAVDVITGAKNIHNTIADNVFAACHTRLRDHPCRPFHSDTKVHVKLRDHTRFYYPDIQVTCCPNPPDDAFQDNPCVIVEILSAATRRIDEEEKKEAYLTIDSLEAYLLIESTNQEVLLIERGDEGFQCRLFAGDDASVPLACLEFNLPLREIYEGVQLPALEVMEDA